MAFVVDRVIICDAYAEPDRHYELLHGGRSRAKEGRRPSQRLVVAGRVAVKAGIKGVAGAQAALLEEAQALPMEENAFVTKLRDEVRGWRLGAGVWEGNAYGGTAMVTRRLLEWWFERDEERRAQGKRFFFAQREAVETLIYLYEVKGRHKMPETEDLLRYALKLATGTGKTMVMAMIITWSTLHKRKVSGSGLATTFLVLVPNLTVRDRVSGRPRGDGLDPAGEANLYDAFDVVPPEYETEFQPKVIVRNWQSVPLDSKRDDWVSDDVMAEGRFIPASVLWAMQRRARRDPTTPVKKLLEGARDVLVINDEAHHVYGEKRARKGEDPEYIRWSKIIHQVAKAARLSLVVDLSATPWYGSGSPKPEGTLFEWLVSDFSVYDAFESGLVKVVRLPEETGGGHTYVDLWDDVKGAKTEQEYLSACQGAIAAIYSAWDKDFSEWKPAFEFAWEAPPVLLVVADNATRAGWLFEHLTKSYRDLRNPDDEDRRTWHTIPIDSKVFDADKGNEAVLREMVNTVGKHGAPGEQVRCIVSVNMLSEGWDVKTVSHILGLRAFGSPLLTEQIIGRGLRRTDYSTLNQPLDERGEGSEETVDAFGIPFVGFPVEKRKRQQAGRWDQAPEVIEPDPGKEQRYRLRVPNVRSWAVGVMEPLAQVVKVEQLPELVVDQVSEVRVRPVVGGNPEAVLTLDQFREQYPVLKTAFMAAGELLERLSPGDAADQGIGPMFDELLDLVRAYIACRVRPVKAADIRDVGIYYWRLQLVNTLENAVRNGGEVGVESVPLLGSPEHLDTGAMRRFLWTGVTATGKKTHLRRVACHNPYEKEFADFLDGAGDVLRYVKNERFGFSVTYFENGRPRQYFPDFVVAVRGQDQQESFWVVETKGEVHSNTGLKRQAAEEWCRKMSRTQYGRWEYLFVQQRRFNQAMARKVKTLMGLADIVRV